MKNNTDKIFDHTIKKDHGIDMQQTLKHIRGHDLVGELIAQAVKRGEFDNLEGTGQPLDLAVNAFEGDLHMAHKILKDNGFAPYWIELGKDIDALRLKFEKEADYFRRYTRIVGSEKRSQAALKQYEHKKERFYSQSRERLVEISHKILDYNLHCPVTRLHRTNINVEAEMTNLFEDVEGLIQK